MSRTLPTPAAPRPGTLALESSSKLGHVCTADDPLVQEMLRSFQDVTPDPDQQAAPPVVTVDTVRHAALDHVIAVGGSLSSIPNALAPQKVLGYVKIAAVNVGVDEIARLKAPVVNPDAIRRLLLFNADTQGTVLPLGNVRIPGRTLLQTLRHTIQATFERIHGGALYDTLEYLVSCAWDDNAEPWRQGSRNRPSFFCPLCDERVWFPRHRREFRCRRCAADLTLVDYLGLLNDATESSSDTAVSMNLKAILEHLTLLTFLRRLMTQRPAGNGRVLLLRDGPLMLRGQSARLVDAVRGFLRHLAECDVPFYLAGVEREGAFVTHRAQMDEWFKGDDAVFVPDNRYTLERIKHAGSAATVYGRKGLYGSKAFCRLDAFNVLVLSVPNRRHGSDAFAADPTADDLVGFERILSTLKHMVSRHFPGVPLPLVAIERLATLPHYPTNDVLAAVDPPGVFP